MLDFICCSEQAWIEKFKMKMYVSKWDSNPGHAIPRQVTQRIWPLGHDALMIISGLMSYRITEYKFINYYVTVTTCVKLIMVTFVFELNVRINLLVIVDFS